MRVSGWAGWETILVNELASSQSSPSLSLMVGWVVGGDVVIKDSLVSLQFPCCLDVVSRIRGKHIKASTSV